MSECDQLGIGGGCGFECPVFLRGECAIAAEIAEAKRCLKDQQAAEKKSGVTVTIK